jgi:hypothetical protein
MKKIRQYANQRAASEAPYVSASTGRIRSRRSSICRSHASLVRA